jgi:hypothetical protein
MLKGLTSPVEKERAICSVGSLPEREGLRFTMAVSFHEVMLPTHIAANTAPSNTCNT